MKTYFSFKIGLASVLVLMLLFTSCQPEEFSLTSVVEEDPAITKEAEASDPTLRINNSLLFPTTARLFGKCTEDWAIEFGKASMVLDCETAFQSQLLDLGNNVIAPYGILGSAVEEYTITKDQYVFLSPALILNDYPCPSEFEFEPADGQSLEDFLKETGKEFLDVLEITKVIINGNEIEDVNKYRLSSDLFYFTGNPDLATCFDPCITGESQPGIVDGYFMMLKKLKVGKHTITVKGEIPSEEYSFEWTIVLNVTN